MPARPLQADWLAANRQSDYSSLASRRAASTKKDALMHIIVTIVVGFIVGLIARAVMPGDQKMGLIMTTLLGIAGSLVAGYGGAMLGLYPQGAPVGWIASIIGALILLFIYGLVSRKR